MNAAVRVSARKHTVAVLRLTLGLSQKEFADLVKRSVATIQSIELGRLALSEELGEEIVRQTGISRAWLFGDEPNKPPVIFGQEPYTRKCFEEAQVNATKAVKPISRPNEYLRECVIFDLVHYANAITGALKSGEIARFRVKASTAMRALSGEFKGEDWAYDEAITPLSVKDLDGKTISRSEVDDSIKHLLNELLRRLTISQKPPSPASARSSKRPGA
ncbi:MAG: helix-turn-helix transcriptional regulator [Verrucomicrobia bacterium]|nr:helix-turn-helix transcriptional regulator [Verrucomicrobiota bacterium]